MKTLNNQINNSAAFAILNKVQVLRGDKGEKGDRGDDGYTPIKGKDYFTDEELISIVNYIQSNIYSGKDGKNGKNGFTPAKGIDYWTEKEQKKIIEEAIKQLPKPKDGLSPDAKKIAEDVVKQISIPDTKGFITQAQLIDFLRRGGFRGGGSSSSSSTGQARSINSISAPQTAGSATATDYYYFVSGTTTVTMPTAVGNTNLYTIKNTGSAVVTLDTTSSETIDGGLSYIINVPYAVTLLSNGSNWFII